MKVYILTEALEDYYSSEIYGVYSSIETLNNKMEEIYNEDKNKIYYESLEDYINWNFSVITKLLDDTEGEI